jgi:hypothetical protein
MNSTSNKLATVPCETAKAVQQTLLLCRIRVSGGITYTAWFSNTCDASMDALARFPTRNNSARVCRG